MRKRIVIIVSILFLTGNIFGQSENDFSIIENAQGGVTITWYNEMAPKKVIIPAAINDKTVTEIAETAFPGCHLSSVTIPNSVTTIGDFAFAHNRLSSVTIGNSVTTIGEWAFGQNRLTSIIIPDSVTTIGDEAFIYNQLTSVTIGSGVTIGKDAFPNNFADFYNKQGRKAGTYSLSDNMDSASGAIPFWVWLAIIGGAAVVGSTAVFLVKWRKK